jgi:hypothetical protein
LINLYKKKSFNILINILQKYQLIFRPGTSMTCHHVASVAALIKLVPAAIRQKTKSHANIYTLLGHETTPHN